MTRIALYGAIIGVISLSAQDTGVRQIQVISKQMISGKPVKGAPYSAQAVNETVQVLADGNRIAQTNTSAIYRDSQGRERREESGADGAVRSITISDPVEGFNYRLRPESKVAVKNFQAKIVSDEKKAAVKEDIATIVKAEVQTVMMTSVGSGPIGMITFDGNSSNADSRVENLGTQTIEGVSAEGTRRTTTIPAGQIGNEQPIVTVNERWYSPELQVLVMSTRTDPRMGNSTYKLTNINRSEPAPTLFQVPPDYTLNDLTGGGRSNKPEEQQ